MVFGRSRLLPSPHGGSARVSPSRSGTAARGAA
jgi:hypothetical protein